MGVFKEVWDVYKENGCELTLHRSVAARLGSGADAAAVAAFVAEMETYLRDPDMFLLMLSVGLGGMFDTQSSFVGLLLREDSLQGRVVDFLLEKLSEFASEMDSVAMRAMEKNIPKLILREIRWIDHVMDSAELVEKLISALPAFPLSLQRDMIYILPEIASDEDTHVVIDAILELIRSEAELVVCCIEALGNFNVENEQTSDVVKCVLERLDSSPLVDLPVIVKYLVQESPGADVDLIANELREKLSSTFSFSDTAAELASIGSVNGLGLDPTRNEEALVLGSIVQGFYFREDLLKAFVSILSKSGEMNASGLCLLDMWVFYGAHSIPRDRLKLEKLFKKKVSTGVITTGLIVRSIKDHANALKSYFGSLLQLASMLITQGSSPVCVEMGKLMYEILFEEFSLCHRDGKSEAAYYQGELVSSLLGFCLSATSETTDAAFQTFLAMVSPEATFAREFRDRRYDQSHFKRRYRFHLFLPSLKQMLDVMEVASLDQVRHIFNILFAAGEHEDAELVNIVRKQVCHQETRYRHCGIIGSVVRMSHMLLRFREDAATWSDHDAQDRKIETTAVFDRWVTELSKTIISQGDCVSFFFVEIRRWVKDLHLDEYSRTILANIANYSTDLLSDRFMEDYNPAHVQAGVYRKTVLGGSLKSDLWISLDDTGSSVYLKILDLTTSSNVQQQQSLNYLSALVELVLECARKTDQLREVESVLVCPIQLMEKSVLEDVAGLDDKTQNAIWIMVWHSVNWIRAIIGFYANETSNRHRGRVVERLKHLVELESILIDELLHSCIQLAPRGGQHDSFVGQPTKTLGVTKKKPGRPAKNAPPLDRADLVRRSFYPLTPDVLKILTFPEFSQWVMEPSTARASDALDSGAIVEFLMRVFENFVSSAQLIAKKSTTSSVPSLVFSDDFRWSSVEGVESRDQGAGVMRAVCRFVHFMSRALDREGSEEDAGYDAIQESARRIILSYLHIGATLFDFSNNQNTSALLMSSANLCQEYFLPQDHQIQIQQNSPDVVRFQVLESCFVAATKFSFVVDDDIAAAKCLLRALLSIAGIAYGYPADQVVARAEVIQLQRDKEMSVAKDMSTTISSLALSFLQRDWSGGNKKYVYRSADLDVLLTCYLNHGVVILDNLQALSFDGILALTEHAGSDVEAFPTLNKKTIAIFHRAMFDSLVFSTSRLDFDKSLPRGQVVLLLNYLIQAVLLFRLLVAITKSYQKSKIVATVLAQGRKFVEVIVRAMPFLKDQFMDHNELVMKVISEVQVATRRMQVLCIHGKLIKDATAAAQVPMVKRLLERFIYKGEELAREHGVLEAFSTGVLKNRRIDGTTISKDELEAMEAADTSSGSEEESVQEAEGGKSTTEDETETEREASENEHKRQRPQKKRK